MKKKQSKKMELGKVKINFGTKVKQWWSGMVKARKTETDKEVALPEVKVDLEPVVMEISGSSVMKATLVILAVLLGAYLLYAIGNILILFFVAFFIASALDPLIDMLQNWRIPRALGVLLVYVVLFVLVALLFVLLVPLIAQQLLGLAGLINDFVLGMSKSPHWNLPFGEQIRPYVEEIYRAVDLKVVALQLKDSVQIISSQLLNLGGNIWSIIMQISNGLLNFILLLILVFFMTVDEQAIENFTVSVFPERYSFYVTRRLQMIKEKIGEWIRGQLMVSIVAAVITFVGLALAGVEYSLLISLITGICMIVPVFGRVVAAIIVLPIVLSQSPALALFLIIYYFAISQVENNILVPLLMNKAVGLSPIVIIFALMVGFQFLGVLGLILAIPMATIVAIFARDIGKRIQSRYK
jgi:predicted PurR-regulated permease PerM